MEEKNRNTEIISMLKEWIEEGKITNVRNYIAHMSFSESEKNALYAKCIMELSNIKDSTKYIEIARNICVHYLDLASGKKFYQTNYNNAYRKEHYKQLNVDIPKEIMEEFEKNLANNRKNKKEFILESILKYNKKCKEIEDNKK